MSLPPHETRRPLRARLVERLVYPALSLLLLAPCYWQGRIQAGDLSSHIYNAWLVQLIESGGAHGLTVARQNTNVLFDLMLSGLLPLFGPEAAQRISVSAAVLVFIWGAFAFASTLSGRKVWGLLPCIAMLAYGWVYHMGFFNFYIALGLSCWAMALSWNPTPLRLACAVVILALAYVAHALPVMWCVAVLAYVALLRRRPAWRGAVALAALGAMAAARIAVMTLLTARWSPTQFASATGTDQVLVFDDKYWVVLAGLLFVWCALLLRLLREWGARRVLSSIPFHLAGLAAAGILILPSSVLIPGFLHALAYLPERMSLGLAICVCGLLGAARPRAVENCAMAAVVLVFFAFLYRDERALNRFEDRMETAVTRMEPGQRVVSLVTDPELRVNALAHMIDRVCVGRCYSYANYEPSTRQFRVRVASENPYVAATYADSWALQTGSYVVRPGDPQIYAVDLDRQGHMITKSLKAGVICGSTSWKALSEWIPAT